MGTNAKLTLFYMVSDQAFLTLRFPCCFCYNLYLVTPVSFHSPSKKLTTPQPTPHQKRAQATSLPKNNNKNGVKTGIDYSHFDAAQSRDTDGIIGTRQET